jgi:regulator of replication initiation timing
MRDDIKHLQSELAAAQADGEKVISLQQQLEQAHQQAAQLRSQLATSENETATELAELRRQVQQAQAEASAARDSMAGSGSGAAVAAASVSTAAARYRAEAALLVEAAEEAAEVAMDEVRAAAVVTRRCAVRGVDGC